VRRGCWGGAGFWFWATNPAVHERLPRFRPTPVRCGASCAPLARGPCRPAHLPSCAPPPRSVGLATLVTVNRWLVAALEEEDAADAEV
jgi:hypothetical protein